MASFRCALLMVATVLAALTAPVASKLNQKALSELNDLRNLLDKFKLQFELESTTTPATTESTITESTNTLETMTMPINAVTSSKETEADTKPSDVTEPSTSPATQIAITPLPVVTENGTSTTTPLPVVTENGTSTTTPLPVVTDNGTSTTPLPVVTENGTSTTPLPLVTETNTTATTPLPVVTDTNTTTPLSAIIPTNATTPRATIEPQANKTEANMTVTQAPPLHHALPPDFRGIDLYTKPYSPCTCNADNAGQRIVAGQLLIVPNLDYYTVDDGF